jgi:hypothetical protein
MPPPLSSWQQKEAMSADDRKAIFSFHSCATPDDTWNLQDFVLNEYVKLNMTILPAVVNIWWISNLSVDVGVIFHLWVRFASAP